MIILLLSKLYPKLFCQWGNNWPNSHQRDELVQQLVEKGQYYYTLSDQSVPQKNQILFFVLFFWRIYSTPICLQVLSDLFRRGFWHSCIKQEFHPHSEKQTTPANMFLIFMKTLVLQKGLQPTLHVDKILLVHAI